MVVALGCLLLTFGYVLLMLAYRTGWARQEDFHPPVAFQPVTFISVIIPARNEANNIGACLESIISQQYPKNLFEVIVVDDHSEDETANIAGKYARENVRYIRLSDVLKGKDNVNAYKKAALSAGIAQCRGVLIVTTDADCIAPGTWLLQIAALYEAKKPSMIVAPVIYSCNGSILQLFQLTDFMSMQGITVATHALRLGNMSNGANLAFSKKAYEHVQGYDGTEHLASGDDYLLMMKIARLNPQGIAYLKSDKAIVSTLPQPTWRDFLQQRIRWASKSGKYNDSKLTAILLLVYLFNFCILAAFVMGIFYHELAIFAAGILLVKIIIEYLFIVAVANFFSVSMSNKIKRKMLGYFPLLQPLHILYIVLAGFLGFIGGYEWKGRKVR